MTELAGTQISNLLEALPGIAKVLRSPVADALVHMIKAASGQGPFDAAQAEELMNYAVRRNLMAEREAEEIVAEARAAMKPLPKVKPVKVAKVPKPKPAPKVKASPKAKAAPKVKAAPKAKKAAKAKPAKKAAPKSKKPAPKKKSAPKTPQRKK